MACALESFGLCVSGLVCADLGSHTGGFVDCLLQFGAARVYSIDTAYGVLAWTLRKDPRVVVLERTNAIHVELPEPVDLVTIDVGWTRQMVILPRVKYLLRREGPDLSISDDVNKRQSESLKEPGATLAPSVVSLIKPHYEARPDELIAGVLPDSAVNSVVAQVMAGVTSQGWKCVGTLPSPIRGHGGNCEVFAYLQLGP